MDSMNIHKSNKTVNDHFTKNKKEVHNSRKNCELLFSHMYCVQLPY